MKNTKFGHQLATDMLKIASSNQHIDLFKQALSECCAANCPCGEGCPCKGKCSQVCKCRTESKKTSGEVIERLVAISGLLDQQGLEKSAALTLDLVDSLCKVAKIKKMPNGKYRVVSHKGKNLGDCDSLKAAKKRLQEVEFFKHKKAHWEDGDDYEALFEDESDEKDYDKLPLVHHMRPNNFEDELGEEIDLDDEYFEDTNDIKATDLLEYPELGDPNEITVDVEPDLSETELERELAELDSDPNYQELDELLKDPESVRMLDEIRRNQRISREMESYEPELKEFNDLTDELSAMDDCYDNDCYMTDDQDDRHCDKCHTKLHEVSYHVDPHYDYCTDCYDDHIMTQRHKKKHKKDSNDVKLDISNTLPIRGDDSLEESDYETCGTCGYDHSYDYDMLSPQDLAKALHAHMEAGDEDMLPMRHHHMTHGKSEDFPSYTSVGSYPMLYCLPSGDCFCGDCASKLPHKDRKKLIKDVFYEGAPEECAECGKEIESAYGNPYQKEEDDFGEANDLLHQPIEHNLEDLFKLQQSLRHQAKKYLRDDLDVPPDLSDKLDAVEELIKAKQSHKKHFRHFDD